MSLSWFYIWWDINLILQAGLKKVARSRYLVGDMQLKKLECTQCWLNEFQMLETMNLSLLRSNTNWNNEIFSTDWETAITINLNEPQV